MRTADIVCALVILALGIVVMIDSIRLDIGWGMDGPQAGFFPFLMSLGLVVCCVAIVVRAVRRKGTSASRAPFMPRQAVVPVLQVIVPAATMVLLIPFIGLYVSAGLYMAFSMRYLGRHAWGIVLPVSVGLPVGFWYLFDKVFLIPMPQGTLPSLLGF